VEELRRGLIAALAMIVMAGCTGSNNGAKAPAAGASASAPAGASRASASTGTTNAPAGATAAGQTAAAGPDPLSGAVLTQADVGGGLQLTGKRPFSNKDYAAMQPNAAAQEKLLDDAGRTSGEFVQFLNNATATPPPGTPVLLGVLDIVSTWKDADAAKSGLATTLGWVTAASSVPNSVRVDTSDVDLGPIGDEVSARHLHATSLVPGQAGGDVFIVGLRRGARTAVLIVSGANGAPTDDLIRQLTQVQNQKLG
jgi:hypothetical protein